MAFEITKMEDNVITLLLQGVMTQDDLATLQRLALDLIRKGQKPRVLAFMESFQGWEKSSKWDDVSFLLEHGDDLAKMAFVGNEAWKDDVFLFAGKGLRSTEIEFFTLAESEDAERWIRS